MTRMLVQVGRRLAWAPPAGKVHLIDTPTVSVVIPTRNEAAWLDTNLRILTDIPMVSEIIVADASSTDRTPDIAFRHGCIVTDGGLPGIGRNSGRKAATSDLILFLDADTYIDDVSLSRAVEILASDKRVAAANLRIKPLSRHPIDHLAYSFATYYLRLVTTLGIGQGLGNALLVNADDFDLVSGFSGEIDAGEDADFLYRLQKMGRMVRILAHEVAWTSPRRFRLEGRVRFFSKVVVWAALRVTGRGVSLLPYRWHGYPADWAIADLRELLRRRGSDDFARKA